MVRNASQLRAGRLLIALLCISAPAAAQSPEPGAATPPVAEIAALRDEVGRLRDEVRALRSAIAEIRQTVGGQTPRPQQAPAVTPQALEILRTQVAEHAQTKVESSSRLPVRLSGTILINSFVNTGEANWLENPNLVGIPPAASGSTGTMSLTARQSRFGFEASGIAIGDWQASGTMITDFFAGAPNFPTGPIMGLPRLVYAFGRIERRGTAVQVGQDHVLLAPKDPTSLAALAFPLLFRAGNLYLRAPQARIEQRFGGAWTIAGGLAAPIAADGAATFEFVPPIGAGERSRRPALEARFAFDRGGTENRRFAAGLSGHQGWRRTAAGVTTSWAVALDIDAQAGRVGAAGEVFTAENAEPFGAAVSQAGRATGGWAEGRLTLSPRTRVAAGFGIDRPRPGSATVARSENRSVFDNVIFDVTPELAVSFEHRWLRTRYGSSQAERTTHHLNVTIAVRF